VPLCQYYAYVEITTVTEKPLWLTYQPVESQWPEAFAMRQITGAGDIYPVFHELFRKTTA
jgi:uncharacterized sporulation protein YeaH/YhbH (DUF444 family)